MAETTRRVATDVGGTFTDLVAFETRDDGTIDIVTAKSDTTPPDFETGVLNVLKKGGIAPESVSFMAHGTTVVINALTERKGVKVGLITTDKALAEAVVKEVDRQLQTLSTAETAGQAWRDYGEIVVCENEAAMIAYSRKHSLVFDYELYDPAQEYHAITSGIINSQNKPLPDTLGVYVFDAMHLADFEAQAEALPFSKRITLYRGAVSDLNDDRYKAVRQRKCRSAEEAMRLFRNDLTNGDEGSIIRATNIVTVGKKRVGGWYKHGRATANQAIGFKLKEYVTTDGEIIGVQQRLKMKEGIPREYDVDGHLVRPGSKDAYEPDDCVGAFVVRVTDEGDNHGIETEIGFGPGFSMEDRRQFWKDRKSMVGKRVEFSHMPHGAATDKKDGGRLRIGKLLRFRED